MPFLRRHTRHDTQFDVQHLCHTKTSEGTLPEKTGMGILLKLTGRVPIRAKGHQPMGRENSVGSGAREGTRQTHHTGTGK